MMANQTIDSVVEGTQKVEFMNNNRQFPSVCIPKLERAKHEATLLTHLCS